MRCFNFRWPLLLTILNLANLCFSSPLTYKKIASIKESASTINHSYDYVIVGGGTSGLTVADRLTEDGTKTVLVIEYGPLDNNDTSIIFPPHFLFFNPAFAFAYDSTPQAGLFGRTPRVLGGAVVGGGSAVNGMFFDRGSNEDYENWARLGNPGWDFQGLLPYFRKATNFTPPTSEIQKNFNPIYDAQAYGNGPIQATFSPFMYSGIKNQWNSFKELGITESTAPASGNAIGLLWIPNSENPATRERSFARTGYYDRDKIRLNYHLLIEHKVLNISISADKKFAYGVSFQSRNDTRNIIHVKAGKEVVLAAGSLHSPQILQRSGVGPKALLEKADIQVKVDLPGVGQNFQDHAYGSLGLIYQNDAVPNPGMLISDPAFIAEASTLWNTNRTGPLASLGNGAAFLPLKTVTEKWRAIISSTEAQDSATYLPPQYTGPLLEGYKAQQAIIVERYASSNSAVMETPINGYGSNYVLQKPLSRGSINLNPADPYGDPIVDFQTLRNPTDVKILTEMYKFARKWLAAPSNQALGAVESNATASISTDAEIEAMLRAGVTASFAHPSCTNPMMPERLGGVVGPDLLVHGVRGLSVVDASIMPLIPATHLSATVYAIAEKAADLIKGRADIDV